ncbi:hypothetical protein PRZ61_04515 [Halomonas pacifica]|jgi:hypothetical protein|uniref:Pentapeptide MXKDX repeat protein n=1 Tax=Halomonas salipaludis TaxID=2032625 RepID=A0A2A2ER16_9GAMM|nr:MULTISPECIES: hypothetical protein [Halomonas]MDC8802711.1 hypothetical protein [Halomonas pacifica]PAU74990.1 hypothetical protein CK498_20790 [Halomonas salipaludis]QPL46157.1 hypothetical protein IT895_18755 [Halomonas sp. A40-4]
MRKRHTAILTAAIIVASGFGAGSLLAQEENQQAPMEGKGMQGDMMQGGGMMGMMSEMNTMMKNCNAMMESMQQGHEGDSNA